MKQSTYIRIPMDVTGMDGLARAVETQLTYSVIRQLKTAGSSAWARHEVKEQIQTLRKLRKRIYSAAIKASGHKVQWIPIVPVSSLTFERYVEGKLRTSLN